MIYNIKNDLYKDYFSIYDIGMSASYSQNKKSIYNWREKNKDTWNTYLRERRLKNKDKCNEQQQNKRMWKKISREFMNILLDD